MIARKCCRTFDPPAPVGSDSTQGGFGSPRPLGPCPRLASGTSAATALISFKKTIARPYWNITGIDPPLASMATPVMFAALVDARNVTT